MAMQKRMGIWCLVLLTIFVLSSMANRTTQRKMRQLYKQYKRTGIHDDGANTIRCISPTKGSVTSQSKILFNLTSLDRQGERLVKAELHFYRRTIEEMKTIQIDVSELSPYYISLVQRLRLKPSGKGWQKIDVTKAVKQCTNTISSYNNLGIGFSDVNMDMVAVPVKMTQFLKHHGLPFILLYSSNNKTLEMDQIANHTELSPTQLINELGSMVDPKTGKPAKELSQRRKRSVIDNKIESTNEEMSIVPLGNDNWINNDDLYNERTNKVEVEKTGGLPTTQGMELTTVKLTGDENLLASKDSIKQIYKVQYLPWPLKETRKKKRRNKDKKLIPMKWKSNGNIESSRNKACERKPLRVNFEDIGWGEQIIEPKRFDAYYCSGLCGFPYSYGKHLTNHAALQSLLTSVQKPTNVPQPCCVPEKLQPVTVMFYDKYRNIILKTYSDMLVESCVCR